MNRDNIFGYPILAPIHAVAGLGNMLFPWARCYLWCKDHGVPIIAPFWTKVRIGPYRRREKDKRNYQRFFVHSGYIGGLRRLVLLATHRKVPEDQCEQSLNSLDEDKVIVVFGGMEGWFGQMRSRHAEVLSELRRITKPAYLNTNFSHMKFIGIHVRRGDFSVPTDTRVLRLGKENSQIPLEWYVHALESIRVALGFEAQAIVFSDGSEMELKELLSLPGVKLCRGAAITDLLALSQACGMIASGSTFGMWASFLGQAPCVWFPSQRKQFLVDKPDGQEVEPELDYGERLPASFVDAVAGRFASPI